MDTWGLIVPSKHYSQAVVSALSHVYTGYQWRISQGYCTLSQSTYLLISYVLLPAALVLLFNSSRPVNCIDLALALPCTPHTLAPVSLSQAWVYSYKWYWCNFNHLTFIWSIHADERSMHEYCFFFCTLMRSTLFLTNFNELMHQIFHSSLACWGHINN